MSKPFPFFQHWEKGSGDEGGYPTTSETDFSSMKFSR